jgi:hypothetical protein
MSVSVALFLTSCLELPDSEESKDKALDNAFPYIGPTNPLRLVASASKVKTGTKIRIISE